MERDCLPELTWRKGLNQPIVRRYCFKKARNINFKILINKHNAVF
jgi:hypothetical protein